jgi:hypothetical protein
MAADCRFIHFTKKPFETFYEKFLKRERGVPVTSVENITFTTGLDWSLSIFWSHILIFYTHNVYCPIS